MYTSSVDEKYSVLVMSETLSDIFKKKLCILVM